MQVRHNTGSCVLLYIPLLETRNEIISKKEKTKKKRHTYSIILFLVFGYRITLSMAAASCHRLERVQGVSRGRGG